MERVENMYSWKSSHGWKVDGLIGGPIDKKREQKGMTPRFDRLERAVTRFDKGRVNGAILIKILCPREILIRWSFFSPRICLKTVIEIWIGTVINCYQ